MRRPRSIDLRRFSLISLGIVIFILLIILPLTSMFDFAFENGPYGFLDAVSSQDSVNAFKYSLLIAGLTTILNMIVGTLIAYIITRYEFIGKGVFRSLIDLPIAIPTAVVGLALMMLYGPLGLLGPILDDAGIQVMMALPGVLLGHIFVTFPFMVRSVSVVLEKLDPNHE